MERVRGAEILLLRHGQSEGNQSGRFGGHGPTPLTALGHAQAAATARAIAALGGLSALYASDLPRAVQTAEPIAQATGIAMVRTAALRERSVGLLTGLTFAEAEAKYPEITAALLRRDPSARPPKGETDGECTARCCALLDQIVQRFRVGRVLLVSHAFTLHLLLRYLTGAGDSAATAVFFRTDNCGLHRLERFSDGAWSIRALNDRTHLMGVDA